MYAVIETGGKQYKVSENQIVFVEKLDLEIGKKIDFDALLVEKDGEVKIGAPFVQGVKVKGEVVEHGKGDKLVVFKYKAKKNYRRKYGHRQPFTKIKIMSIG